MGGKLKFAFYWACSCGGCEVAVLDIHEKILDVIKIADIVFWPCAMDFKYSDVEEMPDNHIDVCFFNGGIRNSEHEHIAKLLRQKSKILIAFGSCAHLGGIPGLANFYKRSQLFERAYIESESTNNPDKILPKTRVETSEGELELPEVFKSLRALNQVIDVDYYLPGCPPPPSMVEKAVEIIASGKLPGKGTVIAGASSVCDECKRDRKEKKISKVYRYHEITPKYDECLLDQGIICMGPAARSGCEAQCTTTNIPCRGCFGPAEGVHDIGAKMLSSLASVFEAETEEEAQKMADEVLDPAGTLYEFSLPTSMLKGKV
ncbi:MAG: oxidoreductase [Armatimonadota bacterium]